MTKVLITGATGNVGTQTIESLSNINHDLDLYAGIRDLNGEKFKVNNDGIRFLHFDFLDPQTHQQALKGCDILFLLRPPQISEIEKYFKPIIEACIEMSVGHIVFISVQGVEKSKIIPHHKIETLIRDSRISYTFLRPAYFMQNFTTILRADIVSKNRICLPAGKARFTLIDVRDIGAVAASILTNISQHLNKTYELTCHERFTFYEMARMLSHHLGTKIHYKSPNLISFYLTKKRENVPAMFIFVMIMLHYFPRFKTAPEVTEWVKQITNRDPTTFDQFILDHKRLLMPEVNQRS